MRLLVHHCSDTDELAAGRRGIAKHLVAVERRANLIFPQHGVRVRGVPGGFDPLGVHLLQRLDVLENVVQLVAVELDLVVVEIEIRQQSYVADFVRGK